MIQYLFKPICYIWKSITVIINCFWSRSCLKKIIEISCLISIVFLHNHCCTTHSSFTATSSINYQQQNLYLRFEGLCLLIIELLNAPS